MIQTLALALLVVHVVPQHPNRARIFGRFVDAQGQAIAGASVLNRVWPGAEFPATTGPDGSFETLVTWPADHRDTWHECSVRAFGFRRWIVHGDLVPGQELDLGVVRLEAGGAVSGRVRLASLPANDAKILVVTSERMPPEPGRKLEQGAPTGPALWLSGGPNSDHEAPIDRGTTSADGRFRIVGLPPGRFGLWVRCDASYWATTEVFDSRAGEETILPDVVLEPLPMQYCIGGQVVDPDGAPVSGALVVASSVELDTNCFASETRTDPDGRFRMCVLPFDCGPVTLAAKVEDGRFFEAELDSVEPGRHDVLLELGRMVAVELQVLGVGRRPLGEFACRQVLGLANKVMHLGSNMSYHHEGRVEIRFPERASCFVTIEATGYEDEQILLDPLVPERTVVLERSFRDETYEVSGVVTAEGLPVPGAHVELAQRGIDLVDRLLDRNWIGVFRALQSNCTVTDDEGRFRMINDFPRIEHHLSAWAEGFAPGVVGPLSPENTHLEVPLEEGGALMLGVYLRGDARGVTLRAYRSDLLREMHCQVGREFRAESDASGGFSFEHLQPGTWLVSAELAPGLLQELGWSEEDGRACRETPFVFAIEDGAPTRGDLDLSEPRGRCRLRGRIEVEDQIREGYAYLQLTGEQALRIAFGGVEPDGTFELTTRAPGTYRLVIHAGPGHHRYRLVTDLVTLASGETVWERSLTSKAWKEEGTRLDHEQR